MFYSSKDFEKKFAWFPQKYQAAQLFPTTIVIKNAENSALHHRNKLNCKLH